MSQNANTQQELEELKEFIDGKYKEFMSRGHLLNPEEQKNLQRYIDRFSELSRRCDSYEHGLLPKTIHKDDVKPGDILPGDILLCRANFKDISDITKSSYTHAAICIDAKQVAHIRKHAEKIDIKSFSRVYEHIAVFRTTSFWTDEKITRLNQFIDEAINSNVTFKDYKEFPKKKQEHTESLQGESARKRLENFVNGVFEPGFFMQNRYYRKLDRMPPHYCVLERFPNSYFCSEFVAAAYKFAGYIEPIAQIVVYPPHTISPDMLGSPMYGRFVTYIVKDEGYTIPSNDDFYWDALFVDDC
ncbi:MAG: hypothetical protein ACKN9T_11985 [Candidatus Methylumidiphilus sp.]